jgi:serine/threonine-protein kinase RsbW
MLRFTSNPQNVQQVQALVNELANQYEISRDTYDNILLSLTEAVTNAIVHGNDQDENKLVEVQLTKCQDTLAFRISDEGPGFDPNSLPDPTAPENLCKCGGRGVFLMRELSDGIEFINNGSTVEIRFRLCQSS